MTGSHEVEGSIPFSSTMSSTRANHKGWPFCVPETLEGTISLSRHISAFVVVTGRKDSGRP